MAQVLNMNAVLHHFPHTPNKCINYNYGYRWPSLLSRMAFADPVKLWRWTTGPAKPINNSNMDMYSAKLSLTTVSTYLVDCVCFYDLLKTQHCYLSPNWKYNSPRAVYPLPQPTPTPFHLHTPLYMPLVILYWLWKKLFKIQ